MSILPYDDGKIVYTVYDSFHHLWDGYVPLAAASVAVVVLEVTEKLL